ncbi:hypothetical protein HYDPIDRAFT_155410, partial [Hydnomerulius pinastri MD-312]
SISFFPDSRRLVHACLEPTLQLWDVDNGSPIGEPWEAEARPIVGLEWKDTVRVYSIAVSHAGDRVAAGLGDGRVQVWTAEGQVVSEWGQRIGKFESVSWSPDDLRVAGSANDGTCIVWEISSGNFIRILQGGVVTGYDVRVCFSPDGTKVATGNNSGISVWDSRTGDLLLGPWTDHDGSITALTWSPKGDLIISGSRDCTVQLWRSKDGVTLHDPLKEHGSTVASVAIHPNGRVFASGSHDGTVSSIVFSPDGRLLAS